MPQILKNSRFVAQIENGFDKTHIITINFEDLQFEKIRTAEKLNSYVNEQIKDNDKYLFFLMRSSMSETLKRF